MIVGVAIVLTAVGLAGVLRAVAIVSSGRAGRFPFDPWVSSLLGFGLIMLGQLLLEQHGDAHPASSLVPRHDLTSNSQPGE
jgi:hypothetical protein